MQDYVYNFTGMIIFQHQNHSSKPVVYIGYNSHYKYKAFWHTVLVHLTVKLRILV